MAKRTRRKYLDKAAWVRIWRGKLLMVRNEDSEDWIHPGGKIRPGERPVRALQRELKEELSIWLDLLTVKHVMTLEVKLTKGKHKGKILRTRFYTGDYSGRLQIDNEVAERDWVAHNDNRQLTRMSKRAFEELVFMAYLAA